MGKSTWAINYMKRKANKPNPFIYVVVTLDEVERVRKAIGRKDVYTPYEGQKKSDQLYFMISEGQSVVITHQLFKSLSWNMLI